MGRRHGGGVGAVAATQATMAGSDRGGLGGAEPAFGRARATAAARERDRGAGRGAGRLDLGPRRRDCHARGHRTGRHHHAPRARPRGSARPVVRGAHPRACRSRRWAEGAVRCGARGLDRRTGLGGPGAAEGRARHGRYARSRRLDAPARWDVLALGQHECACPVAARARPRRPGDQRHERDPDTRAGRQLGAAPRRCGIARAARRAREGWRRGGRPVSSHEGRPSRQRQRRAARDHRQMAAERGPDQRGGRQPVRASACSRDARVGRCERARVAHRPAG